MHRSLIPHPWKMVGHEAVTAPTAPHMASLSRPLPARRGLVEARPLYRNYLFGVKRMLNGIKTGLLCAVAVFAVACGGPDNVAACEEWVDSMSCGTTNFAAAANCEAFESTTCDISEYFECLSSHTTCTDGTPDMSGWAQCVSKASCI